MFANHVQQADLPEWQWPPILAEELPKGLIPDEI